jgi:uracil-DNA glycosylase family protein
MLVGEQPGDQEDLQGRPFVGPAGKMLDRALAELGIDRGSLYLTNVVKHFKHTLRGTRRLHQRPNAAEQAACRMWLEAELLALKPERVVCLGATAAQAFLGRKFRLTQDHGVWLDHPSGAKVMATIHPSALLRMPDREARANAYAAFVTDLRLLLD